MGYGIDRYLTDAYQTNVANSQAQYNATMAGYGQRLDDYRQSAGRVTQGYQDRLDRNMGYLEGYGRSERQGISDLYSQRMNSALGASMSRDPGVLASIYRGFASDQDKARMQLSGQLAGQRIGLDTQLSGDMLGWAGSAANNAANMQGQQLNYMGNYRLPDALSQYLPMSAAQGSPFGTSGGGGYGGGGGRSLGGGAPGGHGFSFDPSANSTGAIAAQGRPSTYYGGFGGAPASSTPGGRPLPYMNNPYGGSPQVFDIGGAGMAQDGGTFGAGGSFFNRDPYGNGGSQLDEYGNEIGNQGYYGDAGGGAFGAGGYFFGGGGGD